MNIVFSVCFIIGTSVFIIFSVIDIIRKISFRKKNKKKSLDDSLDIDNNNEV